MIWLKRFTYIVLIWIAMWSAIEWINVNANSEWTKSTFDLQKKIVKMGVQLPIAKIMIDECKTTAKDPLKCIKTATAIYGNESGFGKHCKNNSCYGVISKKYTSVGEATKDWIKRYNRLWSKHTWAFYFYGSKGKLWASHYCTEERSSGSKVGCPTWAKIFAYFYNKL